MAVEYGWGGGGQRDSLDSLQSTESTYRVLRRHAYHSICERSSLLGLVRHHMIMKFRHVSCTGPSGRTCLIIKFFGISGASSAANLFLYFFFFVILQDGWLSRQVDEAGGGKL